MKYISDYRRPLLAKEVISSIKSASEGVVTLMEVCGTHTVAISRSGIREALKECVALLSGPGCPVCVTANEDIDKAIAIAGLPRVILVTFGDMMKVKGSYSSLAEERAKGRDIRVVYSTLDALEIARCNPGKKVVFFGIGFETTAPTVAFSVLQAKRDAVSNYFVLGFHKLIPPAMKALLDLGEVKLDGFICPGHVSVVIGSEPYNMIAYEYNVPCVISGFEPLDILHSIYMLVSQKTNNKSEVEIQYIRGVSKEGNRRAREIMNEVFEVSDAKWRGIGVISQSGLKISTRYKDFDADCVFDVYVPPPREIKGCSCGEVLRGVKLPYQCRLFSRVCMPENPIGPCMVSSEGACAAYFKYGVEGKA